MNRPYIFCHMMTSLDGKIMENYMEIPEGAAAGDVVIAAVADGSANTQTLFMTREGLSNDTPVGFKLQEAKVMDGDSIWLRYLVKAGKED